jgi:DNA-binding MarR family transcriptional regulator
MNSLTKRIFGLRIRRATDLIGEQGREAFWRTGLALDAKLISIVVALYENGALSSSDIARKTGLLRQLVEARLRTLQKDGYVQSSINADDRRKRMFELTAENAPEVEKAVCMMRDFEQVYEALWAEIGVDMSTAIAKLEQALLAKPLLARLCDEHPSYVGQIKG